MPPGPGLIFHFLKEKEESFVGFDTGSYLSPYCRARQDGCPAGESDHLLSNCGSPKLALTPAVIYLPFSFLQPLNKGYMHNVFDTPFPPLQSPLRENEHINT